MGKINVDKVELKNFLSYGNQWTVFDFQTGINVVLGHDKDKERSNGAGKTSFLEAIPFALFGQINKGISLPKIVNWRNGKQCEVKLHFRKDGVSYMIHRGIKPGILTLFKDGVEVPKLSDKRLFQAELEDDLIGMDFKAAQALLFQNANNMVSMFNTPKADKRRFVEKFFNLEIYSKATEVTNKKLKGVDDKISEIRVDVSYKQKSIDDLTAKIESFVAPDLDVYQGKVVSIQTLYDTFTENNPDLEERLKNLNNLCTELTKKRDELNTKVSKTKEKLGDVRLEVRALETEATTKRQRIEKIGDLSEQTDKLIRVKSELIKLSDLNREPTKTEIDNLLDELGKQKQLLTECNTYIRQYKNEIESFENMETTSESVCPTCFREVDHEHIKNHIESQVAGLKQELVIKNGHLSNIEENIIELSHKHKEKSDLLDGINYKIEQKNKLEQALAKLSGVEEKEIELSELKVRIDEIDTVILPEYRDKESALVAQIEAEDLEYKDSLLEVNNNNALIDKCKDTIRERDKLLNELDTATSILDNQKEIHDRLIGENEANIATKVKLESEIVSTQAEVRKLEIMKDYLEHIKFTLKDENVKQYAISSIIPYLQQQMNHYLSETGNYYVELDNWLDGTIKGFGVGECDFGNMSGGEGKSIDLALKFAMMDVARRQAGSYLDILVLDELLDSSIDSHGLDKMMDIVRMKQREDNLKVFIVSHREEVASFDADRTFVVEKEQGMSNIREL